MSQAPTSQPDIPQQYSVIGGILSYLVPGLGQISQGRIGKGVLFLVCLLSLFHVGQAMGNWQNVYLPHQDPHDPTRGKNPFRDIFQLRWHYAGQFWIGVSAWPALYQYYGGPVPSAEKSPFWHNYQRPPRDEHALNQILVNSDKTPDLGWIYTVIAGMLNILVIYDAFAGPAYGKGAHRTNPQTASEAAAS
ncbi:MAG: hypothetical protein L0Y72_15445 [Gemmataceae bacterium]|nr:hypothetical protein [Gemmataceae bacterium]MCI0740440.1 hypothetical protein [Gemmataceae bacterium]